jgi:hypothetical protein
MGKLPYALFFVDFTRRYKYYTFCRYYIFQLNSPRYAMEKLRLHGLIIQLFLRKSKKDLWFLVSFIIAGYLFPSPANGSSIVYSGTTEGGPTWNRPVANSTDPPVRLSSDEDAVPYAAHGFAVDTPGIYSLFSMT